MRISSVESSRLFAGTVAVPRQLLLVDLEHEPGRRVRVAATGPLVHTPEPVEVETGADGTVHAEVPVACDAPVGTRYPLTVLAVDGEDTAEAAGELVVAEPGWTMFMVSHFHYDPVWWNTQAAYTVTWDERDDTARGAAARTFDSRGQSGFSLVRAHCDLARRDPAYTFVLAEVDYLKPYWDSYPEERAFLRELLRQGRLEIMGGTYNEPNTNLTGLEATARNALYGAGFQRDIMGADPATAWQLDAFGHDPQFPGLMADAGLTSSSWARGPFHQWGPTMTRWGEPPGDPTVMQFPAEFSWLSPAGHGLLTAYMTNHYFAGWAIDSAPTLADAERAAYRLFLGLSAVALTRNVLLPVGGDYAPPCRWVMDIHRDWNARYVWPRFVSGLPRDFFAAVRAELAATGRRPSPQTRDMNPVYTGKDVSYVDTKQAQRYGEAQLADAEAWATLAGLLTGAPHPDAALDKAWRQLVYGAHHDAITGSESDQVYIDLLTGWRELHDLAGEVHRGATAAIAARVAADPDGGPDLVVFNPATWPRRDVLDLADPGLVPVGSGGRPLPAVRAEGTLRVVVEDVPGMGVRAVSLAPGTVPGWRPEPGHTIRNEHYEVVVDPERGGTVTRLVDLATGRNLLAGPGNELLVQQEYPTHPRFGEGPWHLEPTGTTVGRSGDRPARVRVERAPAGSRLTVECEVAGVRARQRLTLWHGVRRLDATTTLDGFAGADQLIRVRWPAAVAGGLPVSEVAGAVVGRGFGFVDVDAARVPWTLDNPANGWFGLSATARVSIEDGQGSPYGERAIGIAELVFPGWAEAGEPGTDLAVALARAGVTATSAVAGGSRYGHLDVDSNLPDVRIAVGTPERNPLVARALAGHPAARDALRAALAGRGTARLWLPARAALRQEWVPGADLRELDRLPLLVVAGRDAAAEAGAVAELVDDLADARIHAYSPGGPGPAGDLWDGGTLAVLNRGRPGFAVETSGALCMSLMRSCTGWPSGFWVDPPRRTAPDGSGFGLQHWTHTFAYALVGGDGDWRALALPQRAHEFNHPLSAVLRPSPPAPPAPPLPRRTRLLGVEPAGRVVVDAVKPAGAPLARGGGAPVDPARGVAVRLHEATGAPVRCRVTGPHPWTAAHATNLLEEPGPPLALDPDGAGIDLAGCGIATMVVVPAEPAPRGAGTAGAAEYEPAQPVYTRYWLHNAGPAPRGNLPVGVYLSPTRLTVTGPVAVTVRVSSELRDTPAAGTVALEVPPGWRAEPECVDYALRPGGFTLTGATVYPPDGVPPGRYWLTATLEHAGQRFADVTALDVEPSTVDGWLTAALPAVVTVRRGGRAAVPVRLGNTTRSGVHGTLWAVSAWGTWAGVTPGVQGFHLPGGGSCTSTVDVDGARIPPGDYWLMVKAAAHGTIAYTPAVPLRVLR